MPARRSWCSVQPPASRRTQAHTIREAPGHAPHHRTALCLLEHPGFRHDAQTLVRRIDKFIEIAAPQIEKLAIVVRVPLLHSASQSRAGRSFASASRVGFAAANAVLTGSSILAPSASWLPMWTTSPAAQRRRRRTGAVHTRATARQAIHLQLSHRPPAQTHTTYFCALEKAVSSTSPIGCQVRPSN